MGIKVSIIVEIAKEFRFEAAHWLPKTGKQHKCHHMHGHSYKVTARLIGPIDENSGWLMDLEELSLAFEPIRLMLDHALLNEIPGLENPTSENICVWIFKRVQEKIAILSSITLEATSRISVTITKESFQK